MKLTLVITHYKEPQDIYKPLFDSIASQIAVDLSELEIIVVQDGNEGGVPLSFLEQYPYTTRLINIPKGGISKARNKGLDEATGEYVMFCDCDDIFFSLLGLRLVFDAIDRHPQMISSVFIEENLVDGYRLIRKENDITFIHGKAFRKDWLVSEKLRFKDELTIHEDGYFVSLCDTLATEKETINSPFYLWRWNKNSTVRKEMDNFLLRTYCELLDSRGALLEQLKKRKMDDAYLKCVAKCVLDIYYDFNTNVFIGADVDLKKKAMLRIRRFWTQFKEDFKKCDGQTIQTTSALCRVNALKKGMSMETVSIREFLLIVENFKI